MTLRPDPLDVPDPLPLGPDRRLWLGLAFGLATIVFLALAVHRFAPAPPPIPVDAKGTLNGNAPLMTRPQLLENQQAMPELMGFDAQTPPANPNGGGAPLGAPGTPSPLGTGALGR
ncbi:MAG: hypothetical protein VKO26_09050 [Cyanobacteriota bacterium]|nr:hypothetical protein [Cyanobacteriota bacterium]